VSSVLVFCLLSRGFGQQDVSRRRTPETATSKSRSSSEPRLRTTYLNFSTHNTSFKAHHC